MLCAVLHIRLLYNVAYYNLILLIFIFGCHTVIRSYTRDICQGVHPYARNMHRNRQLRIFEDIHLKGGFWTFNVKNGE